MADYPINVHVSSDGITFHGRDYDLVTKAIDGTFVEYERVMPDMEGQRAERNPL